MTTATHTEIEKARARERAGYNVEAAPFYPGAYVGTNNTFGSTDTAGPSSIGSAGTMGTIRSIGSMGPGNDLDTMRVAGTSGLHPPVTGGWYQPYPALVNPMAALDCNVKISNIPPKSPEFLELLDSIIDSIVEDVDREAPDGISGLDPEYLLVTFDEEVPTDDDENDENLEDDSTDSKTSSLWVAIVRVDWALAFKLVEYLHGYEWEGKSLEARMEEHEPAMSIAGPGTHLFPPSIGSGTDSVPPTGPPSFDSSFDSSSSTASSSFYNPYIPGYYPYMAPPPLGLMAGTGGPPPPPPPHNHHNHHQHRHLSWPENGWGGQHRHQPLQYHTHHQYQHFPNRLGLYRGRPGSRLFDFTSISRRSTPRSSSLTSSSAAGLPPFILNLVNGSKSDSKSTSPHSISRSQSPERRGTGASAASGDNVNESAITIPSEDGTPVKVNPRRLFVGNIPFTSTWPALKNFLLSRAEEIEPDNDIEILRVEIPMQPLNSRQPDFGIVGPNQPHMNNGNGIMGGNTNGGIGGRGMSRGFAIVTTANQTSSEKLIAFFDDVEFEGRKLTVRFDKFPDFNNYLLQQLYPYSKAPLYGYGQGYGNGQLQPQHSSPLLHSGHQLSKSVVLSNLAFERNLFQRKFYYGGGSYLPQQSFQHQYQQLFYPPHQQHGPHPSLLQPIHAYPSQYVQGMYNPISSVAPPPIPVSSFPVPEQDANKWRDHEAHSDERSEGTGTDITDEAPDEEHLSESVTSNSNLQSLSSTVPLNKKEFEETLKTQENNVSRNTAPEDDRNDDERARELVNSFISMGLSS